MIDSFSKYLVLIGFGIISLFIGWLAYESWRASSTNPEDRIKFDTRADALKMSGIKFDVVPGEEGKITTKLAIFDPVSKNWYPLVPCTDEQRKLKAGDEVIFHYRDKELSITAHPMGQKFCHLEIFSK